MPNRFTRVPDAAVPPPGRLAALLLPFADIFMVALVSRPPSGTLRTTWVTPSTFWMSLGSGAGALIVAIALFTGRIGSGGVVAVVAALGCLAFAAGAWSVATVGVGQRRARAAARN